MKPLPSLLLLTAVLSSPGCTPSSQDQRLSQLLVGTWSSVPNPDEHFASHAIYRADGTNTETVWTIGAHAEDGTRVDGTWKIRDGVLHSHSTASSNPRAIPVGLSLADTIVELSDTKLLLESQAGYPGAAPVRPTRTRRQPERER